MAKATVGAAGIEYIQGAMLKPKKQDGHKHGNYLIMTHRSAPSTNPNCQRIYSKPADAYERSTPPSENELAARNRFAAVRQMIKTRKSNLTTITTDKQNFEAQKNLPGGRKTLTSYLWKICGEQYDAEHNG